MREKKRKLKFSFSFFFLSYESGAQHGFVLTLSKPSLKRTPFFKNDVLESLSENNIKIAKNGQIGEFLKA